MVSLDFWQASLTKGKSVNNSFHENSLPWNGSGAPTRAQSFPVVQKVPSRSQGGRDGVYVMNHTGLSKSSDSKQHGCRIEKNSLDRRDFTEKLTTVVYDSIAHHFGCPLWILARLSLCLRHMLNCFFDWLYACSMVSRRSFFFFVGTVHCKTKVESRGLARLGHSSIWTREPCCYKMHTVIWQ